jgi:O-antigen/teichoic acid export membrane protein
VEETLRSKSKKAFAWSAVENIVLKCISFVVMIFMSRRLTPADYGLVGMITIFTAVSAMFVNAGFSTALIRKQNRTEKDLSSVFYFNIVIAVFLYLVLFCCAPLIADFYNEPRLIAITRFSALGLIIGGLTSVQSAIYSAELDFKTQAKSSITSLLASSFVGLAMAYSGFGVWAILISNLVGSIVGSLILWFYSKWRPKLIFSFNAIKELFSFGSKLLASGLLETIYSNMYSLVIGKFFKASTLGYYARAKGFADLPSSNLTVVLQRVTFPMLCTIQDDDERLASVYRRLLKLSAFVIFPCMVGLAALAKPLIITLLNSQWMYTATLLQIVCFSMMWYPIHAINLNLLQVKGRSDLFFRLEIWKKFLAFVCL